MSNNPAALPIGRGLGHNDHFKTGVLVSDDHETTYEIGPDALDGTMFRFLRPGQRVCLR